MGVCALLAGVQTTAQAFQITPEQVTSALANLRLERSQFLSKIGQLVLRMLREQGSSSVCETLGLPEHVLKVLSGEMVVLPRRTAGPVFNVTRVDREEAPVEDLVAPIKAKVRALYEAGVDVRLIQCLYGLPPVLVHSWGGFSKARNAEKLQRLYKILIDRLQEGNDLDTAITGLRMTKVHAQYLLGDCVEMAAALSVSPERRVQIIEEAKQAMRPGHIARKYGLPKVTVHRWLRGDFTHVGGESTYILNDSWGSAAEKRQCLETYYLGGHNVEQTASTLGLTSEAVTQIVSDFEQKAAARQADEDST